MNIMNALPVSKMTAISDQMLPVFDHLGMSDSLCHRGIPSVALYQ